MPAVASFSPEEAENMQAQPLGPPAPVAPGALAALFVGAAGPAAAAAPAEAPPQQQAVKAAAKATTAAPAAAPCPQPSPPSWSIPAVWEPELAATEVLHADCSPAGLVEARTLPSTAWTPDLIARLSSRLVAGRNRFVCLQLATMAAEQMAIVSAATAAGDASGLRRAGVVMLSTLEAGGELVGAALHYPRAASKPRGGCGCGAAATAAVASAAAAGGGLAAPEAAASAVPLFPHQYVELICVNQPGRGYGSMLLEHVEAFVLSNSEALLRAALRDAPPGACACARAASSPAGAAAPAGAEDAKPAGGAPMCACCEAAAAAAAAAAAGGLRGVKLLSVESAQKFYAANGYSEPDASHEMLKPLSAVRRGLRAA